MITFQKSLAAALLSGAIAVVTPALAGGLMLAQATTTPQTPSATGSATTNGAVTAQPESTGAKANASAAGAANVSPDGTNAATGAYGGMGTDQSTINNDVNKAKKKATSPMNSPNSNMSTSPMTTQPH